jgi:hypothetical protein
MASGSGEKALRKIPSAGLNGCRVMPIFRIFRGILIITTRGNTFNILFK